MSEKIDRFLRPETDVLIKYIKEHGINISNILEIGSLDARDAREFEEELNIGPSNIHVVEPDERSYSTLKINYPEYNSYQLAFSNKNGRAQFKSITHIYDDDGRSSLMDRDGIYDDCKVFDVELIRADSFLERYNFASIDLCKIDVEGHCFEVLQGFGAKLLDVHYYHLEHEDHQFWKDQTLYPTIKSFMEENGFIQLYHEGGGGQSNSFWKRNLPDVMSPV